MSKVKIPEHISEWIEFCKAHKFRFFGSIDPVGDFGEPLAEEFGGNIQDVLKWIRPNQEDYLEAWVNGFETDVPCYKVTMKSNSSGSRMLLHRRTFPEGIGYEWSCLSVD